MNRDLIVFGAGALGIRIGELWRVGNLDSRVVAVTRTDARHEQLRAQGFSPALRDDVALVPAPFVVFCVPPSSEEEYATEVRFALGLWNREGGFVMASSTAVYPESDGGICREDSPTDTSPRALKLLEAEKPVLTEGGCVIRLAGLYDAERGPHRVYARMSQSDRRPDGIINLIHYDDAARLCVAALESHLRGRIFIGCDGRAITREEMAQAMESAGTPMCKYTGRNGPIGRRLDNCATREHLSWTPRYESFSSWAAETAGS